MNIKGFEITIWNGEKMRDTVCIDVETDIAPFHTRDHKLVLFQAFDGESAYLVRKKDVRSFLMTNYNAILVGQNIKFDMGVIAQEVGWPLIYKFYDRNKVRDTRLMFQLWHLGYEGYVPHKGTSLANMMSRFFKIRVNKDEALRCTFGEYLDQPIENIPDDHIEYAMLDVIYTYRLYERLMDLIKPLDTMGTLLSLNIQMKGDLALDSIYKNGVGIDVERAQVKQKELTDRLVKVERRMALWGYIKGRPGVLDIYENILTRIGIADQLPRSPKSDRISSKEDDLREFKNYPFVSDYIEFCDLHKLLNFLEPFSEPVLHPRYNALLNTGRTSASKFNIQQIPREGGIRECIIPKQKDNVFVDIDYSAIENVSLAQVLLNKYGHSVLANAINDGMDIHRYYASILFNKKQEDVTKEERQQAKAAVFGFPGGLGLTTFTEFAKGYGLDLTETQASEMKDKYFEAFPEMRDYLNDCDEGDVFTLSGRRRADATYCAVANTPFQGGAADGAKLALYECMKKYEIVAFIHDAIVVECKEEDASNVLEDVSNIMIEQMRLLHKDVRVGVEGKITRRMEK